MPILLEDIKKVVEVEKKQSSTDSVPVTYESSSPKELSDYVYSGDFGLKGSLKDFAVSPAPNTMNPHAELYARLSAIEYQYSKENKLLKDRISTLEELVAELKELAQIELYAGDPNRGAF